MLLLGQNPIGSSIANDTCNALFANYTNLRMLDLSECQITTVPSEEFSHLHQLLESVIQRDYHFHRKVEPVDSSQAAQYQPQQIDISFAIDTQRAGPYIISENKISRH